MKISEWISEWIDEYGYRRIFFGLWKIKVEDSIIRESYVRATALISGVKYTVECSPVGFRQRLDPWTPNWEIDNIEVINGEKRQLFTDNFPAKLKKTAYLIVVKARRLSRKEKRMAENKKRVENKKRLKKIKKQGE
jgi:hypothetical protein